MKKHVLILTGIVQGYLAMAQWTTYGTPPFLYPKVTTVLVEAPEKVWFGNGQGGGVTLLENGSWTRYDHSSHGFPMNAVVCAAVDRNGNKWFGTRPGGLVKFDGTVATVYTQADGLPGTFINGIAVDDQNRVWVATQQGAARYNGTQWEKFTTDNSGLPVNAVLSVALDRDGNPWFGTAAGVCFYDSHSWRTYTSSNSGLLNNRVNAVAVDAQNKKWFGGGDGFSTFDGNLWNTYQSPFQESVTHIHIDIYGNKWFAAVDNATAFGKGVWKYDGLEIARYNTANSDLPDDNVNGISSDASCVVWFATDNGAARLSSCLDVSENGPASAVQSYSVYPNPATDELTVRFKNDPLSVSEGTVHAVDGTHIRTFRASSSTFGLDIRELPAGIYLLKLGAQTTRFIKQ